MRAAAIAALTTVLLTTHATAAADVHSVDLGWFMNTGGGQIYYDGGFAPWVSSSASGFGSGSTTHTVIGIDVGGILSSLGPGTLSGIPVPDTRANAYGRPRPRAGTDRQPLPGP